MQHDISTPPTSGETRTRIHPGADYQPHATEYAEGFSWWMSTAGDWAGRFGQFLIQQSRERPVVVNSLVVGIVGAFAGARIAQIQAERSRRTTFEHTMGTLGNIAGFIGSWFYRKPTRGSFESFVDRGQDAFGAARDWSGTVMSNVPIGGRPHRDMGKEAMSTVQQIGYGISLIPVTMALIRNPLVRDVAFRYFARRFSGR